MKCPNCGMDIVIATHLCPHCGYAHDFDGTIETRHDIPEPWEITPDKARKRREKKERAAEAWAKGRAGKKSAGRPERSGEARFQGTAQSGKSSGAFARAMHSFSLLSICIMMVLLFGSALLLYSGSYYVLTSGLSADYVYSRLPSLRSADQLLCVCYGLAGLFSLSSLLKLKKREGGWVRSFHVAGALYAGASLLYGVFVLVDFNSVEQLVENAVKLIPFAVYVGLLTIHFRRNSAMYSA